MNTFVLHKYLWVIIKKKFANHHTFEKIIIVLDVNSRFFMICWPHINEFLDLLLIPRDSHALHKYLAFSCVASFRINFLEINFPHILADALSVEEMNSVGFYWRE